MKNNPYIGWSEIFQHKNDGSVEKTFHYHFTDFLQTIWAVPSITAEAICNAVLARMLDKGLYYHTPVHVLNMLWFASEHDIALSPTEELAIWFHDSVYVPTAPKGKNEQLSALFFEAMMWPFVDLDEAAEVIGIINETAKFLEKDIDPNYAKILDLDLCSFLAYCIEH